MQESSSARSLIVQLSSLVNYIDKLAAGSLGPRDLELMSAVNGVLKDCILLQKNLKLKKVKQNMLSGSEPYISDADFHRLAAYLENVKPSLNVSQHRVSRLLGQIDAEGRIDPVEVKENIFAVFETLKNMLQGSEQEMSELQDQTLQSAEAICEVVRRLISQKSKEAGH